MAVKNGTVAITIAVEHIGRVINKFSAAINAAIVAAQQAGTITAADAAVLNAFISSIQSAVSAWKKMTGY